MKVIETEKKFPAYDGDVRFGEGAWFELGNVSCDRSEGCR
jgi:hypothetical protein